MRSNTLWIVLACGLALAACGSESPENPTTKQGESTTTEGESGTTEAPAVAEIGKPVRAFQATDTAGKTFDLAKPGFSQDEAKSAVWAAAKAHGGGDDLSADTALSSLSGVKDDEDMVQALANHAGQSFGLQTSVEQAAALKTLGDVTAWIMAGKDQPITFMVWSPGCPTSRKLNDDINEVVQSTGVRMYAIGGNHGDNAAIFEKFRDSYEFPVRVFSDPKQAVVDVLGGKRTPHFMLVDTKGVLRYRGALHNNVSGLKDETEIENWLADAIVAVQQGKSVAVTESDAVG